MKVFTYIAARWYEARSQRAQAKYLRLKAKAEKFFAQIMGATE